ncbi:hypothetical protein B0H66DRAFT_555313 [Apodospora peruviana]|uniref:Indole-diterpene biosynthesis protein PaxU n=1 Tax=Apodospora peruviana TaxID=516989 RepID=A0AAE0ICZ3_9PEZI|nr:hypothetical protein B0H66DRAFT_555313 [Apodospora peruviana]
MSSNAKIANINPLSSMEKLSPEVFVYRPPPTPTPAVNPPTTPSSPKLILITSWTGALDVHIAKYVLKYQSLYPSAQILLVKSTRKLLFRPRLIQSAVIPAVPIIRACFATSPSPLSSPPSRPKLLIHVFSMGGTSTLANILDAYAASDPSDPILPGHVKILDSCPTVFAGNRVATFLSLSLPGRLAGVIAAPLIYALSYFWAGLVAVGLLRDQLAIWGGKLNAEGNAGEVRRAYIYSEADVLVDYTKVEAHADEAEQKGFAVTREKFVASAHVAHARMDENRYWGGVRRVWNGIM